MAALANLVLNDGQATPAAHTFNVAGFGQTKDNRREYRWADTSVNGGLPIGSNRVMMIARPPRFGSNAGVKASSPEASTALEGMIIVPTMEVVTGATSAGLQASPGVAAETTVWIKVQRPGRGGTQECKDALAFTGAFIASATFRDVLLANSLPY